MGVVAHADEEPSSFNPRPECEATSTQADLSCTAAFSSASNASISIVPSFDSKAGLRALICCGVNMPSFLRGIVALVWP